MVRFGIEKKMIRGFDWSILLVVIALTSLSILLLASVMTKPYTEGGLGFWNAIQQDRINFYFASRQALWFGTGLILMIVVLCFDYKLLGELTHYIYWINIAVQLLMVVLNNNQWLKIGANQTIQPSEFGKIAIIVTFAQRLARREKPIQTLVELLIEIAYIALPVALIILQDDFGTAMVYVAIFVGMLFLSGMNIKLFIGMIAAAVASIVPMWLVLGNFQRDRIMMFLGMEVDKSKTWQIDQAMRAIGSGQLFGKGMFDEATLVQQDFVPVKTSDFIFTSVGETLGFVGCVAVILMYIYMLLRILRISQKARDMYGSMIAAGVMSMFLAHIFENIAFQIKLMPMTGIPLPFLSAGGTSFWANMIAIGLVLSIGMRRVRVNTLK